MKVWIYRPLTTKERCDCSCETVQVSARVDLGRVPAVGELVTTNGIDRFGNVAHVMTVMSVEHRPKPEATRKRDHVWAGVYLSYPRSKT
jgi:hypothetical protein